MNFVEAELYNESLCALDPEPNPDEWPDGANHQTTPHPVPNEGELWPDLDDDDMDDCDKSRHGDDPDPEWDDDLVALFDENQGLTAEGYALLAEMDAMGAFI